MFREIIRELLVFIGAMTVLVALAGIIFNEICWRHWCPGEGKRTPPPLRRSPSPASREGLEEERAEWKNS